MKIKILKGIICAAFLLTGCWWGSDITTAQKPATAPTKPGMDNADCLACHNDSTLTKEVDGKAVSVYVNETPFTESVHGPLNCTDCHTDIKEYPHDPAPQKVSCATCHESIQQEHVGSIHAGTRVNGVPAASCADCHGSHEIFRRDDHRSRINRFKIAETCAGCHTKPEIIQAYGLAPARVIQAYRGSEHGHGMFDSGLSQSATCSDCHGAHNIKGKADPASLTSHANLPATCSKCHVGIMNDFEKSSHGQLWKQGDQRAPICSSCHSSHEIKSTSLAGFQAQALNQCGSCHTDQTRTYHQTFHGKATNLGMMAAAKCSDCHTPHLNLPASDPLSTVSQANVVATCSKCHAQATAKIASFNPHPEPDRKEKGMAVFYVNQFMKWLLLGVFCFFGIHTLLWFQRSIAAWLRKEVKKPSEEGPWVIRFIAPHRITHIVIVMSFLGLAFTGIPLHFSHTEWGNFFTSLLGGVEVSRFFHRMWAIATFGYAFYHIWYLTRRSDLKWNRAGLFGPESIAVNKQDFIDFYRMVKWFLYLGPQPKFDRWTYWEKFDYYAVFWGVPVIGLSGLILWFPWFFTKFLPGSALNIAMIVHGEEALLAVGFIFTFHFFHNHLRPENFPMDTVIFTGKMPLARFQEERPAEYDRMVREGKLDEIMTSPPTPLARLLSFWFGLAALSLGVIIVLSIFVTILFF